MISPIEYIMQLEQEVDKQRNYVKKEKEKSKQLKEKIDKAMEYINIQKLDFRNDDRIIFIFKKLNEILGDGNNE